MCSYIDAYGNITLTEGRVKSVSNNPKSFEELYGKDFIKSRNYSEPEYPNTLLQRQIETDSAWNAVCNSDCYVHIRAVGRAAQYKAEENTFLMDDVFRLYTYWVAGHKVSMGTDCKIKYNADADLWIFYICPELSIDKERYIWIQPPHYNHAIRCIYKGISKSHGLKLAAYDRNVQGFKYITKYEKSLEIISTKFYDEFVNSFKQAVYKFKEVEGFKEAMPSGSTYEWPLKFLYCNYEN